MLLGLVAVVGVVYWYAWRPLPQRSGSIAAPVAAPVTVAFDALGVPHIHAASLEDALFTQGYVTAQDRLWQMDLLRRYNAGDLAEVFGPAALESDRESRRLRMRRIAEDAYVSLPPADRAAFAAYARGVNAYHCRAPFEPARRIHPAALPAAPVERGRLPAHLPEHVPRPHHLLARRPAQARHAARGRPRQGAVPLSRARRRRGAARLQRLGPGRQPHRFRQAAALERHAPGIFAARHLVHGAPGSARPGRLRRGSARRCPASSWATTAASPGASPTWASTCRISTSRRSTSAPAATSFAASRSRRAWSARSSA